MMRLEDRLDTSCARIVTALQSRCHFLLLLVQYSTKITAQVFAHIMRWLLHTLLRDSHWNWLVMILGRGGAFVRLSELLFRAN